MKSLSTLFFAASILFLSAFTVIQSSKWRIAEGYAVNFSGTDAEGIFKTMSGDVQFDENNLAEASCMLKIDVESINTGNGMKNKHAKGKKWFDADNHPHIEFKSSKFSKTENGYEVTGMLKMHGIERETTIPFTFVDNVFKAQFAVNRLDYEIGTMEGMMKKVSNEIKLDVAIPVTKM